MAGGKQTASETRSAIIALFNSGKSRNEILKQLNLARCTVQRWVSEFLKNGYSGTQLKRNGLGGLERQVKGQMNCLNAQ